MRWLSASKRAQAVHLVVEQVHPHWMRRTHGEDVEQRAAHRKLAPFRHGGDRSIPGAREPLPLGCEVQGLSNLDRQRLLLHEMHRRKPPDQGCCSDDQHAVVQARQLVQGRKALGDDVLVWREMVVGQRFPLWQGANRKVVRREAADLFLHPGRALGILGDAYEQAPGNSG